MKRYHFFNAILILVIVLSACSGQVEAPVHVETEDQVGASTEAIEEPMEGEPEEEIQTGTAAIRILTAFEPPTNFLENDEIVGGTTVDIVNEMIKLSSEDIVIEYLPWARAYNVALTESNIMLFTAGKTQEREDLGFHFIGPVATRKHSLLALKESNIKISEFEDLKNYVVAGLNGDWRLKHIEDSGITVDSLDNHEQSYKKLALGRADIVITSDLESLALAEIVELKPADLDMIWTIEEAHSYIIISNGTSPEEVEKWRVLFQQVVDSGVLETHAKKWSDILGVEFMFDKNRGFMIK